ncbi:hypothetical protein BOX15_Mlig015379g2, partial [Macrostomum lignano]
LHTAQHGLDRLLFSGRGAANLLGGSRSKDSATGDRAIGWLRSSQLGEKNHYCAKLVCTRYRNKYRSPDGTYGRIASRSGLAARYGIVAGGGVIDPDYIGQLQVILFNHSTCDFKVEPGDRIAQLVLERVATPSVVVNRAGRPGKKEGEEVKTRAHDED